MSSGTLAYLAAAGFDLVFVFVMMAVWPANLSDPFDFSKRLLVTALFVAATSIIVRLLKTTMTRPG